MCNFLHKDSVPIEKEGIGYKVFRIDGYEILPAFRMILFMRKTLLKVFLFKLHYAKNLLFGRIDANTNFDNDFR